MNIAYITRAGIIAAIYVILTYVLAPVSFGPLQFRLSEALTVLPMIFPESILGLFIGTMLANIIGGLGPWDIFGGSLVTLLAAYLTHAFRHNIIAFLSPIILNAFLISLYLSVIYGMPYWLTVLSIGASEAVVVLGAGYPLIRYLQNRMQK